MVLGAAAAAVVGWRRNLLLIIPIGVAIASLSLLQPTLVGLAFSTGLLVAILGALYVFVTGGVLALPHRAALYLGIFNALSHPPLLGLLYAASASPSPMLLRWFGLEALGEASTPFPMRGLVSGFLLAGASIGLWVWSARSGRTAADADGA